MTRILLMTAALALATPALAQSRPGGVEPAAPGSAVVVRSRDNTGGDGELIVAPGATGASTYQSDSAAAGNAGQPERAVPQGSGGGR